MRKIQGQLRLVQAACLTMLVACVVLAHWLARENAGTSNGIGTWQVIIILFALWSATSGFALRRKLRRRGQAISSKSTPFTRWRAGHLIRLWSATAGGLWALVLCDFHGRLWIADVLFGFAILLLLIWKPDAPPTLDEARSGQ